MDPTVSEARAAEAQALLTKYLPNAGDDAWVGEWPLEQAARPDDGIPVVYQLWELEDVAPAYVGSSEHFAQRLRSHTGNTLVVARWRADRCASITEAKEREGRLISELAPRLNRTTGGIYYSPADWARDNPGRTGRKAVSA